MRIGIIGAPGTGKTSLGKALAKEHNFKLVDGYIQKMQKDTGLALGPWSTYMEIMMVLGIRQTAELKAGLDNAITVNTMLDTIAYSTIVQHAPLSDDFEARRAAHLATETMMRMIGLLYAQAPEYDITFWLPYSEAEQEKRKDTWEFTLDSIYPSVIESFGAVNVYPVEGTTKERVKIINQVIELMKNEPETTETD